MDNYGWDVMYTCSRKYINAQFADNADKLIQFFRYEDPANLLHPRSRRGDLQVVRKDP